MSECQPEEVQLYLDERLSPLDEERFEAHLATCRACQARLDASTESVAKAVSRAFEANEPSAEVDRRILAIPRADKPTRRIELSSPLIRLFLVAAALLSLLGAAWYAVPYISAWRFPGGQAGPTPEHVKFTGIEDADFEISPSQIRSDRLGGWDAANNASFAMIDTARAHSGKSSLKLYKRNGSGQVTQWIPVPLPAGTNLTLGAWVLSPQPGSGDNKYLSIAAGTVYDDEPDKRDHVLGEFRLMDASPAWRPFIINTYVAKPTAGFRVTLSVGAGRGTYQGWDQAVWVDDLFLGVVIPFRCEFRNEGGRLVVDAAVPDGYDSSMIDPTSLKFVSLMRHDRELPGLATRLEIVDQRHVRFVVDDPLAISELSPGTGNIQGFLQFGKYRVAFSAANTEDGSKAPAGNRH